MCDYLSARQIYEIETRCIKYIRYGRLFALLKNALLTTDGRLPQKHWVTRGAAVFTKAGPKVALLGPAQNREPPLRGGVHQLRTAAVVEPAAGKRATSAGWLWCQPAAYA